MELKSVALLLTGTILTALTLSARSNSVDVKSSSDGRQGNYGLLLDAGSTSSKLKIYRWRRPSSSDMPPQLTLVTDKKFTPPLSYFHGKPSALKEHMSAILNWAKDKIPKQQHSSSPFHVLSTAGMRYLHSRKSASIVSMVQNILNDSSINPFAPLRYDDVSVLSGEEEAIYAWIAANYLLGFFNGNRPPHESVGILEMGGGSTQIAFIPKGPLYAEEFQVRLAGTAYSVYVQSYLQFGANGIKIKVADALRKQQNNMTHVECPCSLKDDESTVKFTDGSSVRLLGTGSPNLCEQVLQEILKSATGVDCQPKPCSIGRVYQPSVENITFYAIQAYGYAPRNLEALAPNGIFNMKILMEKATQYCEKPLSEVMKDPKVKAKYASADCLMGLYVPKLLRAYGFDLDTKHIAVTSKIQNKKIDWALGAMIVRLSDRFFMSDGSYSVCTGGSKENSARRLNSQGVDVLRISIVVLCLVEMFFNIELS